LNSQGLTCGTQHTASFLHSLKLLLSSLWMPLA